MNNIPGNHQLSCLFVFARKFEIDAHESHRRRKDPSHGTKSETYELGNDCSHSASSAAFKSQRNFGGAPSVARYFDVQRAVHHIHNWLMPLRARRPCQMKNATHGQRITGLQPLSALLHASSPAPAFLGQHSHHQYRLMAFLSAHHASDATQPSLSAQQDLW